MTASDTIHTRYRPSKFADVIGHDAVVRSLRQVLAKRSSRAFLFTGISGCGKTTLARIVAREVGCGPGDLVEVDAATHTGIDAMRAVQDLLEYRPISGGVRAIIIDECHALSKASFQSMLKILEEPPAWATWLLCTTEPARVPTAIVTRCVRCDLKPVGQPVLIEFLDGIAAVEKMKLGDDASKIISLCAREAGGSPRQALVNLAMCAGAKSVAEARELVRSAEQSRDAIELARALVRGAKWLEVQVLLRDLSDTSPESIRHVIRSYVTKVVIGANSERVAARGISILDEFSQPCNQSDGISPITLACGRLILGAS